MGKNQVLPILALLLLLLGSVASLYVYATQTTTEYIVVHGQQYTINQLFSFTQPRVFADLQFSGIALDDLLLKVGLSHPEQYAFTLKAADGYQKTVTWENMKNGLLTKDGQSVFSDLPKAFRVKDIVSIEVQKK